MDQLYLRLMTSSLSDPLCLILLPILILFQAFSIITLALLYKDSDAEIAFKIAFLLCAIFDAFLSLKEFMARKLNDPLKYNLVLSNLCIPVCTSIIIWIPNHTTTLIAVFSAFQCMILISRAILNCSSRSEAAIYWTCSIYCFCAFIYVIVMDHHKLMLEWIQIVLYGSYIGLDLVLNRIPWSKFVMSFAGKRENLKSDLYTIFLARTVIPLAWNIGFCTFYLITQMLPNLNAHPQFLFWISLFIQILAFSCSALATIRFARGYFDSTSRGKPNIRIYFNEDLSVASKSRTTMFGESIRQSAYGSLDVI
jgi:hypothetical protein